MDCFLVFVFFFGIFHCRVFKLSIQFSGVQNEARKQGQPCFDPGNKEQWEKNKKNRQGASSECYIAEQGT